MNIALLVLRLAVGGLFIGHGAQKLFGAFGGHGIAGTAGFLESIGLRPGRRNAIAAGLSELVGGILLALGFLTPLAALLLISTMVVAIIAVHARSGPWVTEGGYEYNVVLIAVAFAIAAIGPGTISLDRALGWDGDITGTGWAFGVLAVAVLGALATVLVGRRPPVTAHAPATAAVDGDEPRFSRDPDAATRPQPAPPRVGDEPLD